MVSYAAPHHRFRSRILLNDLTHDTPFTDLTEAEYLSLRPDYMHHAGELPPVEYLETYAFSIGAGGQRMSMTSLTMDVRDRGVREYLTIRGLI